MSDQSLQKIFYAGAAAATAFVLIKTYTNRKKTFWVFPDHDMRNSVEVDHKESPNAPYDHAEIGLSELDSAYRSEWVSMGYPKTYHDLEENEN
ncbi:hypothetical protein QWY16_04880 [Planococcus shenhongbingii]|uniref:Uncharacterized protein n=1 Tax=Planococcus shenhongbingii TaxID=3058398 RepID=A0ABT8NF27_9BACL|nr:MULTISPECIES: hypothetical protein [unclassified Planococcus (in: firmicutes)]MDN7246504.1 hypothetical protein [Planococcus sp. N017]WKA59492.1 hypothetical protein QWY16_04880 [Planococcus sp. N016]